VKQEVLRLQEENRQLREEVVSLRQYVDAVQTLMAAIDELTPDTEVMPLLDRILYNALTVIDAKDGSLLVLDDETSELVFVLVHGDVTADKLIGYRLAPGKGIAGWVAQNKRATIVNNVRSDGRFYAGVDDAFQFHTQSLLAAPLIGGNKVLGVIEVINKHNGKPFDQADETLLMLLCRFAGEILNELVRQGEAREKETDARPQAPAS
jgi:sigma-B regulation protein RsbU (phosphoserine phosphatase)